jgi:hypothetical protein
VTAVDCLQGDAPPRTRSRRRRGAPGGDHHPPETSGAAVMPARGVGVPTPQGTRCLTAVVDQAWGC